jgi:Spy/CpxP family protein refolding chaperone
MKKLALTLCIAAVISAPAFAEDPKPAASTGAAPERGKGRMNASPEERAKRLQTELGLNDEQTAKVKAIYEKNQEKFTALRDDKSGTDEERRTKFRELMKSISEEVGPILTPEQKTKFQEAMQRRKAKQK